MNAPFHLIYIPSVDFSKPDRIIDLIQTNNSLELHTSNESAIVMQLEAHDRFEADAEIRELGFAF